MSYVDGTLDRRNNVVKIVERVDGKRIFKNIPCEWSFYYDDPKGSYKTMFSSPVSKFTTGSVKEYDKNLNIMKGSKKLWESDINQVTKTLAKHYLGQEAPTLNICFFDIEVDFHPTLGFAEIDDPFNKITAISLYNTWMEAMITLAIPPQSMSMEDANKLAAKYDNCYMFDSEAEMLKTFLDLISEADVLSGWNSEGYDIPYTVNRVSRILGKSYTRQFCLWNKYPRRKEYEKYGKDTFTYELSGRIHLDSLNLYQQYTYHEMHSYSLDTIAEYELGEHKVQYSGTLDQLYNNDFPKFIDYNRQDTMILKKLNDKLKFIDLANALAHDVTVLIPATQGAVAVTEQAIINFAHSVGVVVPNKVRLNEDVDTRAAGAYVADPKQGYHKDIGAIDINSLYPSAIRALNMSPETLLGQLRPTATDAFRKKRMDEGSTFAESWEGLFGTLEYQSVIKQEGTAIDIDWKDGKASTHSAAEIHKLVFTSENVISGNGTIFDTSSKGIVPMLLEKWYKERQELQAKKKAATDPEEIEFWDKRQLVKKINLNALYGAILNKHCRFYVFDLGQSTTLTGRCITKHMSAFVNEAFTGEYDHVGTAIIYGDTDSVYFSGYPSLKEGIESGKVKWSKEKCTELYDQVSDAVNESFPSFMKQAFNCRTDLGEIIQGGRELVASSGLFISKKRYGLMIYDDEGTRRDVDGKPGKMKAMGMDLKRSDTPEFMQLFLKELLHDVLTAVSEDVIVDKILKFKKEFLKRPSWEKGTPKRVNKLTHYTTVYNEKKGQKGITIPGHTSAAIIWNKLRVFNQDRYSMPIMDGQKTIVCKLKDNLQGYKSVGYPIDELHLPQWFKDLPFDDELMMETIVNKKLDNLLGVLKWDIKDKTDTSTTLNDFFTFE